MSDLLQFVREAWSLDWVQALVAILTVLLAPEVVTSHSLDSRAEAEATLRGFRRLARSGQQLRSVGDLIGGVGPGVASSASLTPITRMSQGTREMRSQAKGSPVPVLRGWEHFAVYNGVKRRHPRHPLTVERGRSICDIPGIPAI